MFKDNPNFAPEYSREEHGWILFPSDSEYRSHLFPKATNEHQAKANVYLIQAITEFVSKPGDTILDPFGGTGTQMVAALMARKVTLIELSPRYHELQQQALQFMDDNVAPGISHNVMLVNAPLQKVLPIPGWADHIIFSPPYSNIMKSKGTDKLTMEKTDYKMAEYTFTSPLNLGLMSDWLWMQEMERVYKKCFETLKPGGTMSIVVKDHVSHGVRVGLSQASMDAAIAVGFTEHSWFKWKAPGSVYTHIRRARGETVVDDEDILICQKPI